MLVADYFKTLITQYNTDSQCGFCWHFVHAKKDHANAADLPEDKLCCVQFFLLETTPVQNGYKIDNDLGDSEKHYTDKSFKALVAFNSKFDIQYSNELQYPEAEGKYDLYIRKLEECIGIGLEIDLCDAGEIGALIYWKYEIKVNQMDGNFDGIEITGKFRQYFI